jgi:hypothetical protein
MGTWNMGNMGNMGNMEHGTWGQTILLPKISRVFDGAELFRKRERTPALGMNWAKVWFDPFDFDGFPFELV